MELLWLDCNKSCFKEEGVAGGGSFPLSDFDLNLNTMLRHLLRAESFSGDCGANCPLKLGDYV